MAHSGERGQESINRGGNLGRVEPGLNHPIGNQEKPAGTQKEVYRYAEEGAEPKWGQTVMGPEMGPADSAEGRGGNVDYGDSSTTDMGPRVEKV